VAGFLRFQKGSCLGDACAFGAVLAALVIEESGRLVGSETLMSAEAEEL